MDCENWILALWNSAEPYALKLFNLIDHNSDFSQFDKVWEIIQQETTIDLKPFPSQKKDFLLPTLTRQPFNGRSPLYLNLSIIDESKLCHKIGLICQIMISKCQKFDV